MYTAQKNAPTKGDWVNLVQEDMKILGLDISDKAIVEMNQDVYKDIVKKVVKNITQRDIHMGGHRHGLCATPPAPPDQPLFVLLTTHPLKG